MVCAVIVPSMSRWTKKSDEYKKWANSKAFKRWEDQHDEGTVTCKKVDKLDCVGHVQKRMGKTLLNLQKGKNWMTENQLEVVKEG